MIKRLSKEPCIHENCQLDQAELVEYTEVGIYNILENVTLDNFSYTDRFCTLQNVEVGKFSNIAAQVRIGPTSHPMDRPTLHHFTYRRRKYLSLIHISEPTRLGMISYAVFCLK